MATRMQQRRGTLAEWTAANPVLLDGELGFETDTHMIRVGDGVTAFLDLPHYAGPMGPQGIQGPQGVVGPQGVIGPQGDTGPQGAVGPQGNLGPQGPAGPAGNAPTGTIGIYAGGTGTLPAGWLLCNGAAVSRTTYAALFAVIGMTYGAGDGSTTFNVPDLRGRVITGVDASQTEFLQLAKTGGEKTHLLTTGEMPYHSHTSGTNGSAHTHELGFEYQTDSPGGGSGIRVSDIQNITNASGTNGVAVPTTTGSTHTHNINAAGGDTAHNNLQPYISMNYMIKV